MNCELKNIANIRFGTFQQPVKTGDTKYLQLKHFNFQDNQLGEVDSFVNTSSDKKLQSHLLKAGDVLLVSKGNRYFAWYYREEVGAAMASNSFFILHPLDNTIDPQFLTLYLNLTETIERISSMSIGTSIASVKKEDLLELLIAVPPLEKQRQIVNIGNSHHQQIALLVQLKKSKEKYYSLLMNQLLRSEK